MFVAKGNEALAVFVVDPFVDEEVFADNNDAARAVVAWDLDQHVRRVVNWKDVFPDDMVQSEIHLIES